MYYILLLLYQILSYFLSFITLILWLILSKNNKLANRLALKLPAVSQPTIWFHCASVGEFNSAKTLITNLLQLYPNYSIYITTHTATSQKLIQDIFKNNVYHSYLPLDNPFIINIFLKKIKPKLVIWLEQDFFPNFLTIIHSTGISILLLNARMSDKSFHRWLKLKFIISRILENFDRIYTSSLEDLTKYQKLGSSNTSFIGNLKYTTLKPSSFLQTTTALDTFITSKYVFLALSTHDKEEVLCIDNHYQLSAKYNMITFIAPRHPQRCKSILSTIASNHKYKNLKIILYSSFLQKPQKFDILLIDAIGISDIFCSLANITFVGKSLFKDNAGGHNILEPLEHSCPVLFGPYVANFKSLANECLKNGAGIMLQNPEDLKITLEELFTKPYLLKEMQHKTSYIFKNSDKILEETLNSITKFL